MVLQAFQGFARICKWTFARISKCKNHGFSQVFAIGFLLMAGYPGISHCTNFILAYPKTTFLSWLIPGYRGISHKPGHGYPGVSGYKLGESGCCYPLGPRKRHWQQWQASTELEHFMWMSADLLAPGRELWWTINHTRISVLEQNTRSLADCVIICK